MRRVRLGDVIDIKHGYAFPGDLFSDDPSLPTLVTPGNFARGGGFQQAKPKTFSGDAPKDYILAPGDLLITMTDLSRNADTLGLPSVTPPGRTFLHNQRIGKVSVVEPSLVSSAFLAYRLRLNDYRSAVVGSASGTTVRHTSPTKILAIEITLPDLRTQRAIAEVLGSLDDKIAANERVAEKALGLARATFTSQTAGLARVPISEIALPLLGGTPDRAHTDYWVGSVPWISVADVTSASCGYVLSTKESITEEAAVLTRARPAPKGTTIVSARGTVGAIGRTAMRASFNQSCYAFPPDQLPPHVLFLTISEGMQEAVAHSHGSVFQTITMQTFEHLLAPDTRSIAGTLEPHLSNIMERGDCALRENRALAATRDALLPALMCGERSVSAFAVVNTACTE